MDDENAAVTQVENGKDYAVIIFPENFTKNAYWVLLILHQA